MTHDLGAGFSALADRLRASTVTVVDANDRGSGCGVVWDARGSIVTNAHVVRGRTATVGLPDGSRIAAAVLARDPDRDLALLRIAPARTGLVPADVRDAATLVPGELVIAIGNPHGIPGAVTAGLVHRCNARWVVADVRLAPGNSGGPLADTSGRVVGINSMIARGLALAIPSGAVLAFVRAVRERSHAA